MILGSDGKANLSFELEKEVTVENCSIDDWRKNMFEDRRYVTTRFVSTLFSLQASNGIYRMMQDKFPKYVDDDSLSRIQIREKLRLEFYSRRRYNWNLTCEKNPKTSSKTFFSAIHDIRYFFYSEED